MRLPLAIASVSFALIVALAFVPYSPGLVDDMGKTALRAMNASIVGEADRKTAGEYGAAHGLTAREVERRYAATGNLVCQVNNGKNEEFGQAQLTLKNDIITTAAHVLMPGGACNKAAVLDQCRFVIRVDGKDQGYPIASVIATGYTCPYKGDRSVDQDWSVLRLEKSVDARVKPYGVRKDWTLTLHRNENVVLVGRSGDWPTGSTARMPERPRHYGDCKTGSTDQFGTSGLIEHDCDTSDGASGGSLLTPGPEPVLLGVTYGSIVPGGKKCDPEIGKTGRDEFKEDCWAGLSVPVAKNFQAAILKAAGADLPSFNNRAPEGFKLPSIKMK